MAVDVAPPSEVSELTEKAWQAGIPLIKVESFGFYGALSTQIEEICRTSRPNLGPPLFTEPPELTFEGLPFFLCLRTVVETHPESLIDLRLNAPFPELIQFAQSEFDYSTMDSAQHSHVPAVVILVKALEVWKSLVSPSASIAIHSISVTEDLGSCRTSTREEDRKDRKNAKSSWNSSRKKRGKEATKRTLTKPWDCTGEPERNAR